jgi:sporulation integral membrane protein YlbJ
MLRSVMLGLILLLIVAAIVRDPSVSFQAALQGLSVWWTIVFPGLLPFIVLSELLFAFGMVHAIGVLLEPFMRRVFRLPGAAGWAVALGWAAGYPSGPDAASRMTKAGLLTPQQGQRLAAIAHMPSPMLMLLVIGAGFLHHPAAGAAIAVCVWSSGLIVGLILAWLDKDDRTAAPVPAPARSPRPLPLPLRAVRAMEEARLRDGRGFGQALGDAVTASVQRLLAVGGFMIGGAVLIRLLEKLLPASLKLAASPGIYEVHLGTYAISTQFPALHSPLGAALAAGILAWSGWCALLASQSFFGGSGLRLAPLAASKLLHGLLAYLIALWTWQPLLAWTDKLLPAVFGPSSPALPVFLIGARDGGALQLPILWQASLWTLGVMALLVVFMTALLHMLAIERPSR